ncbi:MAG TPA: helix-turn-helix transcriptional regulator [Candidatus Avisuccinivibrio pullicola]|nr:helix-turn-helix transcriptional regulator [Candidatus Avisuccinivibrio pullicola]
MNDNCDLFQSVLSERLMKIYAETGIYTSPLPHSYLSRFDYDRPVIRQFAHPTILIFCLQGGRASGSLNGKDMELLPGSSLLLNTFSQNTFQVAGCSREKPALFVNIPLLRPQMGEVLSHLPSEKRYTGRSAFNECEVKPSSKAELLALNMFLYALSKAQDAADYELQMTLKLLYVQLLQGEHGNFIRQIFASNAHDVKLLEVIHYISEHYHEAINTEALCSMAFMSKSNFYKHFSQITGVSPSQFIRNLRLYEGRRLILTENYSASRAAYAVGYQSSQHFSRDYKKLFNCSPVKDVTLYATEDNPA